MQHLVSIIMPAYNAARYLSESVESVRCQTFVDWELIVIDDGSEDETAEIAKRFAVSDARVRVISQANGGQASARNSGLAAARGDLIAFLDADDLWVCDKLERQVAVMEKTGVDLVYTDGEFFCDEGELGENDGFDIVPGKIEGAEMFSLLFQRNRIATLSVLVRKSCLDTAGGFDPDRKYQNCEDYDVWLTLANSGVVFYGMPEKLMRYRRHSGAATLTPSKLLKPMLEVIKKHSTNPSLDRKQVKNRIRWLSRDLISALVREERLEEARARMREFSEWDRGYTITGLQRFLLSWFPAKFNYLSRELLYRSEWHFGRALGSKRG